MHATARPGHSHHPISMALPSLFLVPTPLCRLARMEVVDVLVRWESSSMVRSFIARASVVHGYGGMSCLRRLGARAARDRFFLPLRYWYWRDSGIWIESCYVRWRWRNWRQLLLSAFCLLACTKGWVIVAIDNGWSWCGVVFLSIYLWIRWLWIVFYCSTLLLIVEHSDHLMWHWIIIAYSTWACCYLLALLAHSLVSFNGSLTNSLDLLFLSFVSSRLVFAMLLGLYTDQKTEFFASRQSGIRTNSSFFLVQWFCLSWFSKRMEAFWC